MMIVKCCLLLCSPTPKAASPTQSSKTHVADSQQASAPTAADKDDKAELTTSPSAASRTKEPTPPRPKYCAVVIVSLL